MAEQTMKQMMMGLAVAVFTAGAAYAQDAPHRSMKDRADMRTEQMVKELGLDEKQAEQVKAINVKYAEKVDAMRSEGKEAMQDRQAAREEMQKAQMQEYKGVLTAEQYAKLEARQKEMEARRMERRDGMQMKKGDGLQKGQGSPQKAPAPKEQAK